MIAIAKEVFVQFPLSLTSSSIIYYCLKVLNKTSRLLTLLLSSKDCFYMNCYSISYSLISLLGCIPGTVLTLNMATNAITAMEVAFLNNLIAEIAVMSLTMKHIAVDDIMK